MSNHRQTTTRPRKKYVVSSQPLQAIVAKFNQVGFFSELNATLDATDDLLAGMVARVQEHGVEVRAIEPFNPYRTRTPEPIVQKRREEQKRCMEEEMAFSQSYLSQLHGRTRPKPQDVYGHALFHDASTTRKVDGQDDTKKEPELTPRLPDHYNEEVYDPVSDFTKAREKRGDLSNDTGEVNLEGDQASLPRIAIASTSLRRLHMRTAEALHAQLGPLMSINSQFLAENVSPPPIPR